MAPDSFSSANNSTNQIDASHLYFLHHSNNPTIKLVSEELDGDNFGTWVRAMEDALSAKNKLCFVDGTKPMPASNHKDFVVWKRCNDMVKSWLVHSICTNIANSVLYATTAEEIWNELHEHFSRSNGPRIYQLRRDIEVHMGIPNAFQVRNSSPIHLRNYRIIGNKSISQIFLMGLNASCNTICGQILLMDPLPIVNKAHDLLLQEEKQRSVVISSPSATDSTALASFGSHNGRNNHAKSHGPRRCPKCDHVEV